MKKLGKLLTVLSAVAILALGAVALVACGGGDTSKVTETYIGKHVVTETTTVNGPDGKPMEQTTTTTYYEQLQLRDDGTYEMTQLQGSEMATYFVYATGKYTKNAKDAKFDGYTEIVLEKATYVQINQDIYNHMFGLTIDTETSSFPHEIAGGAMLTKDDIFNKYGDFGSRYITHRATVDDTHAENWMDIEDDVNVVE